MVAWRAPLRRCRFLFQKFNLAPYVVGMNKKVKDKSVVLYRKSEKKSSLSAKKLGEHLTKIAVSIAAKNESIKGSKDYKKVDKALIHLCEAIGELNS